MSDTKRYKIKRTLLFTIPSVIVVTLILSYGSLLMTSFGTTSIGPHPNITVSSGQGESSGSLIKLATYTTGVTLSKQVDAAGMSIWVKDNSHVMLTLYDHNSTNGTTIVATATNIGTGPITLSNMNIVGAVVNKKGTEFTNFLNSAVIGCTADSEFPNTILTVYANGTSVSHTVNQTVACTNPAASSSSTLSPGESVTGRVNTSLNVGNEQISRIGITASYTTGPESAEYTMVMPYQIIK